MTQFGKVVKFQPLLLEIWEETIEVILPKSHYKHTGVTSTVLESLPILEKSTFIAPTGAKLSKQGKSIPLWKPLFISRKTPASGMQEKITKCCWA